MHPKVGEKDNFLTQPDRFCLIIIDSESQAQAMLTLKDLEGKPFPMSPDVQLNTLLVPFSYPMKLIIDLFVDEHDIAHVS